MFIVVYRKLGGAVIKRQRVANCDELSELVLKWCGWLASDESIVVVVEERAVSVGGRMLE